MKNGRGRKTKMRRKSSRSSRGITKADVATARKVLSKAVFRAGRLVLPKGRKG